MSTARCVDGPYAGQTFDLPWWKWGGIHRWKGDEFNSPLMWIIHGTDRHCYTMVEFEPGRFLTDFYLVYRDTF